MNRLPEEGFYVRVSLKGLLTVHNFHQNKALLVSSAALVIVRLDRIMQSVRLTRTFR